jgi:hypothetical protein
MSAYANLPEREITFLIGYVDVDTLYESVYHKSVSKSTAMKVAELQDAMYDGSMVEDLVNLFKEDDECTEAESKN